MAHAVPAGPGAPPHDHAASPARTRVDVLDALRGTAILGILLYNVADFTGYEFITDAQRASLPASGVDGPVGFAREWLVQGKFYSLFSLLFGIGLGLQLGQAPSLDTRRRIRRRLLILLAIGLAHSVLIWFGDILVTYAVLGLVALAACHSRQAPTLARWGLALLVSPIVLYGALLALVLALPAPSTPPGADEALPPAIAAAFAAMPGGSYLEVVTGNAVLSAAGWGRRLLIMALPRILGMFLIGLWVVRSGWLARIGRPGPAEHAVLARLARMGLLIGLPLAAAGAWLGGSGAPRMPTLQGWLEITVEAVATPLLAVAYAAVLVRWHAAAPSRLAPAAAVGRMALTNYLMHSILGVALFYGIGLGLWGTVALAPSMAGAVGLVGLQALVSTWWLRRAYFGPVEWLWRQGTYGQRLPLLRGRSPQALAVD
jgi:uncharacterized protein